jgi:hypothetical protein
VHILQVQHIDLVSEVVKIPLAPIMQDAASAQSAKVEDWCGSSMKQQASFAATGCQEKQAAPASPTPRPHAHVQGIAGSLARVAPYLDFLEVSESHAVYLLAVDPPAPTRVPESEIFLLDPESSGGASSELSAPGSPASPAAASQSPTVATSVAKTYVIALPNVLDGGAAGETANAPMLTTGEDSLATTWISMSMPRNNGLAAFKSRSHLLQGSAISRSETLPLVAPSEHTRTMTMCAV